MIYLVAGSISALLSLAAMFSTTGKSRREAWAHKERLSVPSIFQVLWFFFSLVAMLWGYLLISLGE